MGAGAAEQPQGLHLGGVGVGCIWTVADGASHSHQGYQHHCQPALTSAVHQQDCGQGASRGQRLPKLFAAQGVVWEVDD